MIGPATRKDLMIVNMGPHHPSVHGVLRLIITLDGEDVIDSTMFTEEITVNAPEQLGNIQVPKRARIVEYQKLITRNPIFLNRVEGIGTIGGEEAINWGLLGQVLRASRIRWDLRKVDHYEF
ncbi:hypothetical protein L2E82_37639 [Cichorium intybus]|uniref:Uncharacterized protein n=1 Tax=Cichorium intybus TaxID=13427 RepID=A0ACB9AEM1_CICIN|nr:hypothetical protein L2E82_37639 [Cichorium intybus]